MNTKQNKATTHTKQNKTKQNPTKYNADNHQTIVFVVGGAYDKRQFSKSIYFMKSDDILRRKRNNYWRKSDIELPCKIWGCKCIITEKNTDNPKLIILGGLDENDRELNIFWQREISDIIGNDAMPEFLGYRGNQASVKIIYF